MPSSVEKLFTSVSLSIDGHVRWGSTIKDNHPGVYVVTTTSDPNDETNVYGNTPPIDMNILQEWIDYVPTLRVDKNRPTPHTLKERLAGFWLPDEPILYIGKATSLRSRVQDYYCTKLGDERPHKGGHWLKTLSILDSLSVFWAITACPVNLEYDLMRMFIGSVSTETRRILVDSVRPYPFANLQIELIGEGKKPRKRHGLNGQVNRRKRR